MLSLSLDGYSLNPPCAPVHHLYALEYQRKRRFHKILTLLCNHLSSNHILLYRGGRKPSTKNILAFATGADAVPPLGFLPTPTLEFNDASNYPIGNTCGNF